MSALAALLRRPLRAEEARRPRLRLVRPPRRRHTPAFALLYVVLAGLTVFTTVSLNAMAAGDLFDAERLEVEVAESERTYARLVAEVARLEAPDRVRRAALDLGMIPAESPRYIILGRRLPSDDAAQEVPIDPGLEADPVKPVLSAER